MLNPVEARPARGKTVLARWLAQVLGQRGMRVKFQVRGNDLHILCDGLPCPEQAIVLSRLVPALEQTALSNLLADPPLYQAIVYGRALGQSRPSWTSVLQLKAAEPKAVELKAVKSEVVSQPSPRSLQHKQPEIAEPSMAKPTLVASSDLVLSNRSLARRGDPDGIARYLSESLSALGVAVRVKVKSIPYPNRSPQAALLKRLWITCEANYTPDPALISEPIAQKLRELELEDYRDAIALIQVWGEAKPDWMLRVDLTPRQEMLREWGRWGDAAAIARLLQPMLADQAIHLDTITLKEATLHLCCRAEGSQAPPQQVTVQAIAGLLQRLGPQGIHTAAIYGHLSGQDAAAWVEWLRLPAHEHPALADSAFTLAQGGDWEAIAFLLNRLLNPDLDQQLATGGIHSQLLPKQNLLHVMLDAPACPSEQEVGPMVVRFLKPLHLPEIDGVRIYGRRSGQKQPVWSYGTDFTTRQRFVPEATPEFAATDAYVGDLIARPDDLVMRPDLTAADVQTAWERGRQRIGQQIQHLLLRTQLFAGNETEPTTAHSTWIACVWGLAGLLLMVQADWLLGRILHRPAAPTSTVSVPAPTPPSFAGVSLQRSNQDNSGTFARDDFTTSGSFTLSDRPASGTAIVTVESPFATFNSRQFDEKIALYHQRVQESGAPDVLIVGSSRALRGIDPSALRRSLAELDYPNVDVFNLGVNGATAQVVDLLLRRILTADQLPRLILWADGARAFNSGNIDVTYNGIVASEGYRQLGDAAQPATAARSDLPTASPLGRGSSLTDSYETLDRWLSDRLATISTTHSDRDQMKAFLQQGVKHLFPEASATLSNPDAVLPSQGAIDFDGFLPLSLRFNPVTYYQEYARVAGAYDSDYEAFRPQGHQSAALDSLLQFTRDRRIPVVFVNLPLTQDYLDPTRSQYEQQFREFMVQRSLGDSGLIFRDLGQIWLSQYDYFSDPSHLNRYGAYEISKRLAQDPMIPWAYSAADPLHE